MKTSFLICNYNSDDLLLRCIKSIYDLNYNSLDIYIYDNCSTDNSLELVIQKYPDIIANIIRGDSNLGYPKAINSLAKVADGDNIFILNPDAVLQFTSIDFVDTLNKLEYNHIVGFQIYNEFDELQNFDTNLPGLFWLNSSLIRFIYPRMSNLLYDFYFKNSNSNLANNEKNLILIPGCSLLLKRQLFYDLGMYNEDYFLYFDDTELLYNAYQKDCQIYISNLKIKHNASYTVNKLDNILKVEKYKSFLIYVKKMYSYNYYIKAKFNLLFLCLISFTSPSIIFNSNKRNYFYNLIKIVYNN
jgi:GT2 family glycosyltransferase